MASEKIIYWGAVAVMAVSLSNHFANRYQSGCLADRVMATVQRLSGDAGHFLALGQVRFGSAPMFVAPEIAMARAQSGFASLQANMARQQAACARLEAQRARMMAMQQMENMRVICPRQRMNIEVPQIAVISSDGTI